MIDDSTVALSFRDLSVSSLLPAKNILNNVSGYVVRGGITAGEICAT